MLDSLQVSATASVGIAYGSAGAGSDEMLRNADLAMYTAKAGGKNCCRVFAREMHLAAVERLDLEAHLRGAAERGELVVHYQPIYELRSRAASPRSRRSCAGSTPSAACSARCRSSRSPRRPASSTRSASTCSSTACEEAARVDRRGRRGRRAGGQRERRRRASCSTPTSPTGSSRCSTRCGLEPDRLILEITEGALMKDPGRGRRRAAAPERPRRAARGRRLRHRLLVARLPAAVPDRPAEDRRLVRERHPQPVGLARSCAAIVQIAHTLGLMPVAEGVESAAQAEALAACGCDLAQGFHLGRPGRRRRDPGAHRPAARRASAPLRRAARARRPGQGVVASSR